MKVKIKDGSEVELNIGDKIDYQASQSFRSKVTVIGLGIIPSTLKPAPIIVITKAMVIVTWDDCPGHCRLGQMIGQRRKEFNIGPEWSDDTWYYTIYTKRITKVHPANKSSQTEEPKDPSQQSIAQKREAAWGKQDHKAPSGAAFEFL